MRLLNNERGLLFWSAISVLAFFLAGSFTNVDGYPMIVEVDEEDERVSLLTRSIRLSILPFPSIVSCRKLFLIRNNPDV